MIIVDTAAQAWNIEVDNSGVLTAALASGSTPTSYFINDTLLTVTYLLTATAPVLPATAPTLVTTPTTTGSHPTGLAVFSPLGAPYLIQVTNGVLDTVPGAFASARDSQVHRESISTFNAKARDAEIIREAIAAFNAKTRDAQINREIVVSHLTKARNAQIFREAIIPVVISPPPSNLLLCSVVT